MERRDRPGVAARRHFQVVRVFHAASRTLILIDTIMNMDLDKFDEPWRTATRLSGMYHPRGQVFFGMRLPPMTRRAFGDCLSSRSRPAGSWFMKAPRSSVASTAVCSALRPSAMSGACARTEQGGREANGAGPHRRVRHRGLVQYMDGSASWPSPGEILVCVTTEA